MSTDASPAAHDSAGEIPPTDSSTIASSGTAPAPTPPVRTLVIGIVNVTPDSFSDGGCFLLRDGALAHGRVLIDQGADMLDVGGESTRPGATRVGPEEELARVMPVIERLTAIGIPVSIDTMRAGVAAAAVLAGARLINDVSGGLADPAMIRTAASLGVDYVCQRWRGPRPPTLSLGGRADQQLGPGSGVDALLAELVARRDACLDAGMAPEPLVLDPGLGFGTTTSLDWDVLRRLDEFAALGHRLLVGPSRKRFLTQTLPDGPGTARRDAGTAATATLCAVHGAWAVRVHEVVGSWAGVRVAHRLAQSRPARPRPDAAPEHPAATA